MNFISSTILIEDSKILVIKTTADYGTLHREYWDEGKQKLGIVKSLLGELGIKLEKKYSQGRLKLRRPIIITQ